MASLSFSDDALELTPLQAARAKLAEPAPPKASVLALLGSAGLAAVAALTLAATVIIGPPPPKDAVRAEPISLMNNADYAPPN